MTAPLHGGRPTQPPWHAGSGGAVEAAPRAIQLALLDVGRSAMPQTAADVSHTGLSTFCLVVGAISHVPMRSLRITRDGRREGKGQRWLVMMRWKVGEGQASLELTKRLSSEQLVKTA